MSSTRSIIAPPPFAANALTVIPPTPVAGVSYRDPVAGPASSADGWPYAERVNSAEWNQIMYQISSLVALVDKKGVLGWSSAVDYTESSIVFGSDGNLYVWLAASGPSGAGAKDPISEPTYWFKFNKAGSLTETTNGSLLIPAGVTSIQVSACGGGGGGGGGGGSVSGTNLGSGGGGGGAGQSIQNVIYTVNPGSTISWTIGSAGAKGVGVSGANGTTGGNGGNTVITGIPSGTVTLVGGSGGSGGVSAPAPAGSIGGAGFPRGGSGSDASTNNASANGAFGGGSPFGSGGSNGRGGIAGAPSAVNNGSDADGYGGGGGAGGGIYTGASTQKGGDGGNGTPGFISIGWN